MHEASSCLEQSVAAVVSPGFGLGLTVTFEWCRSATAAASTIAVDFFSA